MILRITKAQLINEDMWLVWLNSGPYEAPVTRLIPAVDHPEKCPGGIWCEEVHPGKPY